MKTVVSRFSKETVLVISLLLAVISMFLVPPGRDVSGIYRFSHAGAVVLFDGRDGGA